GDHVRRRGGRRGPRAGADPGQGRALPGAQRAGPQGRRELQGRPRLAVPGPPRRLPDGPGGGAEAQEISYLHAEGYPAAELKHGPIALVEEGTPVVVVHPSSHIYAKMLTNIQEVAARGAAVLAIAEDGDREVAAHAAHVLRLPATAQLLSPLVCLIPLHLVSYHVPGPPSPFCPTRSPGPAGPQSTSPATWPRA